MRSGVLLAMVSLSACSAPLDVTSSSRAIDALTGALPELEARHQRRAALESVEGGYSTSGRAALAATSGRVLTAHLPEYASGVLLASDSGGSALAVRFLGAAPVVARRGDRELVWPDAFPLTDVRAFADELALEVDYLLRGPRAPRRFRWLMELPPGAEWSVEPGGRLLLLVKGEAVLAIPRPTAVDATGLELAVRVEQVSDGLEFTLVDEPRAWPALLDPVIEVPVWRKRFQQAPSARTWPLLVYDANRAVTVLFGGLSAAGKDLRDTWEWDGARWLERSPATVPAARTRAAGTWDPVRGNIVMFGGDVNNTAFRFGDTLTWNGTDWVLMSAPSPGAFLGPSMTFDTTRGFAVLVGSGQGTETNVATWDGVSWTSPFLAVTPPYLVAPAFAFDEARQVCVLHGGTDRLTLASNALWEWDGAAWTDKSSTVTNPPALMLHRMVFDPSAGELLLLPGNGSLFTNGLHYEGTRFAQAPQALPPRQAFGLTLHGALREPFVFGGEGGAFVAAFSEGWQRTGASWALIDAGTDGPAARTNAAMAFDSARGLTLLTGGQRSDGSLFDDTWAWDGGAWGRVSAPSLGPRARHALVFDPLREKVVVYGGSTDLRAFDGTDWAPVGAGPKSSMKDVTLAFDPGRQALLQLGGRDAVGNSSNILHVQQPDGGWAAQGTSGGPTQFVGRMPMVFDEALGELTVLGDTTPQAEFRWDGGWSSTALTPLSIGLADLNADLVYDPDRQVIVGVGTGREAQVWERHGGVWAVVVTPTAPPADASPRLAYDSLRRRVVLQTGGGATWEYAVLRPLGSDCVDGRQCSSRICVAGACSDVIDAGLTDAGLTDAGLTDAGLTDAGLTDAGLTDAGLTDAGLTDAGLTDAGLPDAGSSDGGDGCADFIITSTPAAPTCEAAWRYTPSASCEASWSLTDAGPNVRIDAVTGTITSELPLGRLSATLTARRGTAFATQELVVDDAPCWGPLTFSTCGCSSSGEAVLGLAVFALVSVGRRRRCRGA